MRTAAEINAMPLDQLVRITVAAAPPLPDDARAVVRSIWSAAHQAVVAGRAEARAETGRATSEVRAA